MDSDTNEVRYIGKTNNIATRYSSHINDTSKSHKASWIKSLKDKGKLPVIEVLEEFECEKECYLKEIEYISFYDNLTNHHLGGVGGDSVSMRGHTAIISEDTVLQIRDLLLFTDKSIQTIAEETGSTKAIVNNIAGGKSWSYLTGFTGEESWIRGESIQNRAKALKDSGLYDRQSTQVYQYDLNDILIREFKSISEASRVTGTNRSSISQCLQGKVKTANNYKWKRKDVK